MERRWCYPKGGKESVPPQSVPSAFGMPASTFGVPAYGPGAIPPPSPSPSTCERESEAPANACVELREPWRISVSWWQGRLLFHVRQYERGRPTKNGVCVTVEHFERAMGELYARAGLSKPQ